MDIDSYNTMIFARLVFGISFMVIVMPYIVVDLYKIYKGDYKDE